MRAKTYAWTQFVEQYPEDGESVVVRCVSWPYDKQLTFNSHDPWRDGPSLSDDENRRYWYPERMSWRRN